MSDIRCKSCNALNSADAQWCGQCLARFVAPAPPPPVEVAAVPAAPAPAAHAPAIVPLDDRGLFQVAADQPSWTCSWCKMVNSLENDACYACGTPFSTTLQAASRNVSQSGVGRSLIGAAVGAEKGLTMSGRARRVTLSCWTVLASEPSLLVFALFGILACGAVAFLSHQVLMSISVLPGIGPAGSLGEATGILAEGILTFLFRWFLLVAVSFYISYFIAQLVKAAVVAIATPRLGGFNARLVDGLAVVARLIPLIAWSMIGGTVAFFLGAVERLKERSGDHLGLAFLQVVGVAWRSMTVMVIPVILFEPNERSFMKRAARLFKQQWGEAAIGETGIFAVCSLVAVPMGGVIRIMLDSNPMLAASLSVFFIGVLAVIAGTLGGVLSAVLYRYATVGEVSRPFMKSDIETALRGSSNLWINS